MNVFTYKNKFVENISNILQYYTEQTIIHTTMVTRSQRGLLIAVRVFIFRFKCIGSLRLKLKLSRTKSG